MVCPLGSSRYIGAESEVRWCVWRDGINDRRPNENSEGPITGRDYHKVFSDQGSRWQVVDGLENTERERIA